MLAGAEPYYLNCTAASAYLPDFDAVPAEVWRRCRLIYTCSPGNPAGAVMPREQLRQLLELADRYDFVIAADECYSEIYPDAADPPVGLLQLCAELGRADFARCLVFNSLSKRSNLPGLRSGFVAGDAGLVQAFLRYRTYHGCAPPLLAQAVSAAAWADENHVDANRRLYRQKFAAVEEILAPALPLELPQAGFFLWLRTPQEDELAFTRELYQTQNVTVLPGRFLARDAAGVNPGRGRVRIALVATLEECVEAAGRLRDLLS